MKVTIAIEARFARLADGSYWYCRGFNYSFWQNYLNVFNSVNILARVQERAALGSEWQRVDGEGVSVSPLSYYHGPQQYLFKRRAVARDISNALAEPSAVILRVPGVIAWLAGQHLMKRSRPFALEVLGDPYEVFSPGAIKHPLRPYFRWLFTRRLKTLCQSASAASYVTKEALQKRYPISEKAFASSYSDVQLNEQALSPIPWQSQRAKEYFHLINIGSLETYYKAPDIIIQAINRCLKEGMKIKLTFIGDGRLKPILQKQVEQLNLQDHISFVGQIAPGKAVRDLLDSADLFILPSRTEGLPRALIEAMARGLPCLGTNVGGIPELLDKEDLVPRNDAKALAAKIISVLNKPSQMQKMAKRNLNVAQTYQSDKLKQSKDNFYRNVAKLSKEHFTAEGICAE